MDSEKDSSRSHPTSCSWWRKADFVAAQGQKYAVTERMSAQQPCSAHTLSAQQLPAFSLQFSPCLVMRLFSFLAQLDFLSFAYLNHHLREKNKKFKHITNFYKHFSLSPTLYQQPLTAMSQIHVEEVEVTLDISDQSKAIKTSITVLFQYKSSVLIFFYYIPKLEDSHAMPASAAENSWVAEANAVADITLERSAHRQQDMQSSPRSSKVLTGKE